MTDGYILILLVVVVSVLVLIIAKLASFLTHFAEDTRCICYEMDHADSYEEYRRWRGELRCHYLMLIPFVTEKNVMRLYDRIFHRSNRRKSEERKDGIAPLLMPSILGICICLVCVCGMTWAWYTASVETSAQKMTAAYYEVTVKTVIGEGSDVKPSSDGVYDLSANTTYTITLQASGSVEECGGYCLIECGDTQYYTQTFKPKQEITITLTPITGGAYTFTGIWGSIPTEVDEADIIKANTGAATDNITDEPNTISAVDNPTPVVTTKSTVQEPAEEATYTVQSEDTMATIEPTVPQETAPTESDSMPTVSSVTQPTDTPVTESVTEPVPTETE